MARLAAAGQIELQVLRCAGGHDRGALAFLQALLRCVGLGRARAIFRRLRPHQPHVELVRSALELARRAAGRRIAGEAAFAHHRDIISHLRTELFLEAVEQLLLLLLRRLAGLVAHDLESGIDGVGDNGADRRRRIRAGRRTPTLFLRLRIVKHNEDHVLRVVDREGREE